MIARGEELPAAGVLEREGYAAWVVAVTAGEGSVREPVVVLVGAADDEVAA